MGIIATEVIILKILKHTILFYIGCMAYMFLEFAWRGRSHGTMFILGGLCFLLVGGGASKFQGIPIPVRPLLGAGVITGLELITGWLVNQDHKVCSF